MYDYTEGRKLRLVAVAPWVTVDQMLERVRIPAARRGRRRACSTGPTDEELHILRTELDPRGQNTAERSAWVIYDGETYTRAEG